VDEGNAHGSLKGDAAAGPGCRSQRGEAVLRGERDIARLVGIAEQVQLKVNAGDNQKFSSCLASPLK
jgi:hypothetical protein